MFFTQQDVKAAAISIILIEMMSARKIQGFVLLILLLLLGFTVQVSPGSAQVTPTLAVDPSRITVPLGNQVRFELEVSDGQDVNAFDMMINYDLDRLTLLDWEHGDYLSNITCTHIIRQPGILELKCNQVSQPEVDGDGILLVLTFETTGIGFPDVTITEAAFIDSQGDLTYPVRQHALVEVTLDPTFTPTATITFTPTVTFTPTAGFSPTPSNTATPTSIVSSTPSPTAGTIILPTATLEETEPPYPEEATVMETEAAYPIGEMTAAVVTPMPDDTSPPDQTSVPTDETGDQEISPTEPGVPSPAQALVRGLWKTVLWGTLILGALILLGIGMVYILRRKQKSEEDLLL
ncbi:MAG TPA: hypothetical protein DCL08_00135 [Anaerolineaceae bacterium]|nr:hypothetical protein [Anaerolineaceae bacterium]